MTDYTIYRTVGNETNSFIEASTTGKNALNRIVDRDLHLMKQLDIPVSVEDITDTQVIVNFGDTGVVYTL